MTSPQNFLPQERRQVLLQPVRCWTPARKARLLFAIADGLLTEAEARAAHGISAAEINEWCRGLEASDTVECLKATVRVPA